MTTVPRTRTDLLAARKAAAGVCHFAGYAGAVADAGVADAVGAAAGADAAGDALAGFSGNITPISWPTSLRSRNLVAPVVMPAA